MRHFIVKAVIACALIFVGVGGGVYVGTAISDRGTPLGISPEILANNSYIKIGDSFPDYELKEYKSESKLKLSSITKQKPALLLFVSSGCGACVMMASSIRNRVLPDLRKDIKVILIYDSIELEYIENDSVLLNIPGSSVYGALRKEQIEQDGMFSTPAIVAINPNREIKFIMTGFNPKINAEFINENL